MRSAYSLLLTTLFFATPYLAQAQETPGFATVERVYPVGEEGTTWKLKCSRRLVVPAQPDRSGLYTRSGVYEHDRPEVFNRGRRQCIQTPRAKGDFVGFRARVNERGRIFDQFVSSDVQVGDRVRVSLDAGFVGYDEKRYKERPDMDWGDNYFPGYPYSERY